MEVRGSHSPVEEMKKSYFTIKVKKDLPNPYFSEQTKKAEGKYEEIAQPTAICGTLVAIYINEYEYEGKPKKAITFQLMEYIRH